jgi:hypothetical protein
MQTVQTILISSTLLSVSDIRHCKKLFLRFLTVISFWTILQVMNNRGNVM